MKYLRFRAALLVAGLLFAVLPPSSGAFGSNWLPREEKSEIIVPFRTIHDEIVISMSLNGHKGMNFVVDTGTGASVLDVSTASYAGVKVLPLEAPPSQSLSTTFAFTQVAPGGRVQGHGLDLYGSFMVGDLNQVARGLCVPIAGIIGFDFLRKFRLVLDYSAQTMTLVSPKRVYEPPQGSIQIPVEAPIVGEVNGPVLRLGIDLPDGERVPANLTLDTGSANALSLHVPFVQRHRLAPQDTNTVIQGAFGGTWEAQSGSVPALLLGTLRIPNVKTLFAARPVGVAGSAEVDGEIGYELLSRFRIFIDGPHRLVVFEPQTLNGYVTSHHSAPCSPRQR